MARSISVKVPTSLLISQIEERLAQIDKEIEEYPAKRKEFEAGEEVYRKETATFIVDYLSKNLDMVGYDHDSVIRINSVFGYRHGGRVEVSFDTAAIPNFPLRPEAPQAPNQRESFGRDWATRKELLEKNLRILKMTSQEEVNASTYGAIMDII